MEKKRVIQRLKEFFNGDAPMTNGNKYDVIQQLETQKQLDLQTLEGMDKHLKNGGRDLNTLTEAIRKIGEDMIKNKNIEPYFLLHMQADYFCNTCKFKTEDINLYRNVINIIRGSFFMGTAGLYRNTKLNILEPVYATGLKYGIDGVLLSAKILPLSMCLQKMNETQGPLSDEGLSGFREIKDCENLALFSWGTMGYSCWIRIWPFINLQHLMLTIIINNGYVYNKKWIYRLNAGSTITKEIELFFNPLNPFIVNIGNTEDISNRITTEEGTKAQHTADVIDYYNKMIGVYYQLLGRKINTDYKKERNISDEVQASQENYDVVQSDWLNQFKLFIMQLKEWGLKIEFEDINEMEEEKEEEDGENNDDGNNRGE